MSLFQEQPWWIQIAFTALGLLLIMAAFNLAWSDDFHRITCVTALNITQSNVYLANCLQDYSATMDAYDPIVSDGMQGTICESFYWGFSDQSIHDQTYATSYYCQANNKTYVFDKTFYNTILKSVVEKLGGQLNETNETTPPSPAFNSSVSPTPTVSDNALATDALTQYLQQIRNEKLDAQTQLLVQQQITGYACLLTSARKIEMYERWNKLDETAKKCLPNFLALNKTTATAFAALCSEFPFSSDKNYAAYLSQATLNEYADNEFALRSTTQVKVILADTEAPEGEIPFTYQTLFVYKPYQVTQGCLIEFKDKTDKENAARNAGSDNAVTIITIILLILGAILFAYKNYGGGF